VDTESAFDFDISWLERIPGEAPEPFVWRAHDLHPEPPDRGILHANLLMERK